MTTQPKETAPKTLRQLCNGEEQRAGYARLHGAPGCFRAEYKGCADAGFQSHAFSTLKEARAKFAQLAAL